MEETNNITASSSLVNKKIGRPLIYASREIQILESRRKLKMRRCVKDITHKFNKFNSLANDEEKVKFKNSILNLFN